MWLGSDWRLFQRPPRGVSDASSQPAAETEGGGDAKERSRARHGWVRRVATGRGIEPSAAWFRAGGGTGTLFKIPMQLKAGAIEEGSIEDTVLKGRT